MISSKKDLIDYIQTEKKLYINKTFIKRFAAILSGSYRNKIFKYQKYLRKEEYYCNCKHGLISNLGMVYYKNKKRKLGLKLGIDIGINAFDKGLHILHPFGIIVNGDSNIGENCIIHGSICIGNKGDSDDTVPTIGDNANIGFGSVIIGNIRIGNDVVIGSNSLVNKSFEEDGVVIAGCPAKIIGKK